MLRKTTHQAVLLVLLLYVPLPGVRAATLHNLMYVSEATLTRDYQKARRRLGPTADKAQLFAAMLGLDEHMTLVHTNAYTIRGILTDQYTQTYRHIPIYHRHLSVKQGPHDRIVAVGGSTIVGLDNDIPDTTARITPGDAMRRAESAWARKVHGTPTFSDESIILRIYIDKNDKGHLAYLIQCSAQLSPSADPSAPFIVVDAHSGKVLHMHNGVVVS